MFTVGQGWLTAGELAPGDAIRDSSLRELTVLTVTLDTRPQIVHNLEIADAHTYFAGELEAWGHNAGIGHNGGPPLDPFDYARNPRNLCEQLTLEEIMANPDLGQDTGITLGDKRIPAGAKKDALHKKGALWKNHYPLRHEQVRYWWRLQIQMTY